VFKDGADSHIPSGNVNPPKTKATTASLAQDSPIAAAAASVINNEKSAQEPEPKINKTKEA